MLEENVDNVYPEASQALIVSPSKECQTVSYSVKKCVFSVHVKKKKQVKVEEEKKGEQKSTAETVIKTGYIRGVKYEFWKPEQDSSVGKVFVLQSWKLSCKEKIRSQKKSSDIHM